MAVRRRHQFSSSGTSRTTSRRVSPAAAPALALARPRAHRPRPRLGRPRSRAAAAALAGWCFLRDSSSATMSIISSGMRKYLIELRIALRQLPEAVSVAARADDDLEVHAHPASAPTSAVVRVSVFQLNQHGLPVAVDRRLSGSMFHASLA